MIRTSKNGKYQYDIYDPSAEHSIVIINVPMNEFFNIEDRKRIIAECGLDSKKHKIGFQFTYGK